MPFYYEGSLWFICPPPIFFAGKRNPFIYTLGRNRTYIVQFRRLSPIPLDYEGFYFQIIPLTNVVFEELIVFAFGSFSQCFSGLVSFFLDGYMSPSTLFLYFSYCSSFNVFCAYPSMPSSVIVIFSRFCLLIVAGLSLLSSLVKRLSF